MTGRRLLALLAAGVVAAALSVWLAHRTTAGRALSLLERPELRESLRAARELARDSFQLREQQGLSTDEVRARSAEVNRGLLLLEEVELLRPELDFQLGLSVAVPVLLIFGPLSIAALVWARGLLKPIERVTLAVRRYTRGDETVFPIQPGGGPDIRMLGTALNEMASTIRGQKQALATQSRFLGWRDLALEVSHEMKNLLTPLRLSGEEVMERAVEQQDAPLRGSVQPILQATHALQRMVGSLGDLSQRRPLEVRPVPARPLLEACVAAQAPRGVPIHLDAEPQLSVLADPEFLQEAITNLLVNAAEAGAQRIELTARVSTSGMGDIELSCRDDGPGIPPELLPRIRKLSFTTKKGGSGFGLYFADKLATQLGGRLDIQSRPGEGTQITMVLPHADAADHR